MVVYSRWLAVIHATRVRSSIESLNSGDRKHSRLSADSKMSSIPKGRGLWPQIRSVRSQICHLPGVITARKKTQSSGLVHKMLLFQQKFVQKIVFALSIYTAIGFAKELENAAGQVYLLGCTLKTDSPETAFSCFGRNKKIPACRVFEFSRAFINSDICKL